MRILFVSFVLTVLPSLGIAEIVEGVPSGWYKTGTAPDSYLVGTDAAATSADGKSAVIQSKADAAANRFGTLTQTIAADDYRGKRVRLSAMLRSENIAGWGGIWLRVDGKIGDERKTLEFDNMQSHPVVGTTSWRRYEIVLNVPQEATNLAFGFLLAGKGTLWASGLKVEEVGNDVPTTGGPLPAVPKAPVNLNFQGNSSTLNPNVLAMRR